MPEMFSQPAHTWNIINLDESLTKAGDLTRITTLSQPEWRLLNCLSKGQVVIDILLKLLAALMQKKPNITKSRWQSRKKEKESASPFVPVELSAVKECFSFDGGDEQEESRNLCERLIFHVFSSSKAHQIAFAPSPAETSASGASEEHPTGK